MFSNSSLGHTGKLVWGRKAQLAWGFVLLAPDSLTASMNFTTGHFNLFPVLNFVAEHPQMPGDGQGDPKGYLTLVSSLVNSVPQDKPGWYLWGRFNDIGWWETVYLGKAGNRKTSSLKRRIMDEILEERTAFWATVYGKEFASKMAAKQYNGRYNGSIPRSLRKCGAHFILWVAGSPVTEEEISREEKILIDIYRPTSNAQRIAYPERSPVTDQIIRLIDREIKELKDVKKIL